MGIQDPSRPEGRFAGRGNRAVPKPRQGQRPHSVQLGAELAKLDQQGRRRIIRACCEWLEETRRVYAAERGAMGTADDGMAREKVLDDASVGAASR